MPLINTTKTCAFGSHNQGSHNQGSRGSRAGKILAMLALILGLGACAGGKIIDSHPMLAANNPNAPKATVYFIRPRMLKPKGYADNSLTVKINDRKILEIAAGAYTMMYLKPGKARVSTHSLTAFTNRMAPIPVSRYRDFVFQANYTYFIHLDRINEEFRGVFFDPKPADLREVRKLLESVTAFGEAQEHPIEEVDQASIDKQNSTLPPAFPEDLYPVEKYVLHPSPFKR